MKKLAAIFLFSLFLFNIAGYRIVFFLAQHQSDVRLEASLDKSLYNESNLITLKVPFNLPYQTDEEEFQRVDGEINFNGKIYKYVKRKIQGGNVILLCLPDYNKMRIIKEKDDFYKDANNIAQTATSKKQDNSKGSSFKNILSEYDQLHFKYAAVLFAEHISHSFSNHKISLSSSPHSSPDQPPELF